MYIKYLFTLVREVLKEQLFMFLHNKFYLKIEYGRVTLLFFSIFIYRILFYDANLFL